MFKIMQSGAKYDNKHAEQRRNLYYAVYDNVPKIEFAGLGFYELNDLLALQDLSASKQKKLANLKLGDATQLFNVGTGRYYYAVCLTTKEEEVLQKLKVETESLDKINKEIENQVGHLIKQKNAHEKEIKNLKDIFNK